MNPHMESSSVGTKEWLETTQGWIIYAYVGNEEPIEPVQFSGGDFVLPPNEVEAPRPMKRRTPLPFGENVRDTIRFLKGI